MDYFIGVDGGGTKTAFVLADGEGKILASHTMGSANYKQVGMNGLMEMLKTGLQQVMTQAQVDSLDSGYVCIGIPMYRESKFFDACIEERVREELSEWKVHLVNDCEVGWAGSLGLEDGINLVAGTGSISFGRNGEGQTVSVGGWSDYFSDEGSCKWLGTKCMELFSKEADGRLPKGPLYNIIWREFGLESDKDIIDIFEQQYMPYRDKIASLQKLLLQAANEGDPVACRAYEDAAEELLMILEATARRLRMGDTIRVTCSGGLFRAGKVIFDPLLKKMEERKMVYTESFYRPEMGALLLAAEFFKGKETVKRIRKEWEKKDVFN